MVGTISHELRTPLNGILSLLQCMREEPSIPKETVKTYISPCLDCSHLLLHLINDILDFTQISFRELRMVIQPVNIRKEVNQVVDWLAMKASLRGIDLLFEIDEDVPIIIHTDPNRLK